MSNFNKIKQAYRAGSMDKASFIKIMYDEHAGLFEYSEHLAQCNITEIKITGSNVIVTFKDPCVSMICPMGDMRIVPLEIFNFGDYERAEIQCVRDMVAQLGGNKTSFLDIGANVGFYSLALSSYFPGIKGVAFEPIPTTYASLQKNFELNGVNSVIARNLGLSHEKGEFTFYTYPSQSGASSMTHNVDSADVLKCTAQVMKLDDYCMENETSVDFLKCDVEGAELLVFKGGENILKRDLPIVFTEMLRKWCAKYDYHPNDIIDFFKKMGYRCLSVQEKGCVSCDVVNAETVETNFIFLHKEKHASIAV